MCLDFSSFLTLHWEFWVWIPAVHVAYVNSLLGWARKDVKIIWEVCLIKFDMYVCAYVCIYAYMYGFLSRLGWPGTCCVVHTGFKLVKTCFLSLSSAGVIEKHILSYLTWCFYTSFLSILENRNYIRLVFHFRT